MNFPSQHPLNQTMRSEAAIGEADVVVALEAANFFGALHAFRDQVHRTSRPLTKTGVKLAKPIPVHIVYLTAWADESGGLFFFPDIYGYDARPPARGAGQEERRAS